MAGFLREGAREAAAGCCVCLISAAERGEAVRGVRAVVGDERKVGRWRGRARRGFTLRNPPERCGLLGMSTAGSYTGVEQVAAVRPVRNVSDDDEGEMRCWARTRSRIRPMGARPRMRGLRRHPCRAPEGRLPNRDRLGCTTATASPPPRSPVRRPPLNVCTGQQVRVGAGHSPSG